MTDREKKIAEIRRALEKATPGPWVIDKGEGWTKEYPRNTYIQARWKIPDERRCVGYRIAEMSGVRDRTMADALLIAQAPEWLEWAVQEIERLREENEGRKKIIEAYMRIEHDLAEDAERYLQQRDKLIEVLRWYADEDTHMIKRRPDWDYAPIVLDHGKRARNILLEIGVTVE